MLALVLARGGSKRLPGKNIKDFAGKPMIHYTLETAMAAKGISRVLLSTDCEEIRSTALQVKGVEAPFLRPDYLAEDGTQAYDVHVQVLDWLKENEGQEPEEFCLLLPTSPLRLPEDIDNAIDLYRKRDADVVTSVYRTKPLAWHLDMVPDTNKMVNLGGLSGQDAIRNHQEMPEPPVVLNGSIYIIKTAPYRKSRTYFVDKTYGYEMPVSRSIDIDEMDDFILAEAIMKQRQAYG